MQADDITKILGGLGFGAGAGAVVTAIINSQTNKGKSRAEAADILVGAAERIGNLNKEMDRELKQLKKSLDSVFIIIHKYEAEEITKEELLNHIKGLRS